MVIAQKDKIVSPEKGRNFFKNVQSSDKVKLEFEVGHEILANQNVKNPLL